METHDLDELYQFIIKDNEKKKKKKKIKDDFLSPDETNTVNIDLINIEDDIVENFKEFIVKDSEKAGINCKIKPCITQEWLIYLANLNRY